VIVPTAGVSFTLLANKEFILSAGAFQSPQLLMVSEIDPEATLKAHGILEVQYLEGAGLNLCDQPFFGASYRVDLSLMVNSAAAAA
jgi:choline dehydrogenase